MPYRTARGRLLSLNQLNCQPPNYPIIRVFIVYPVEHGERVCEVCVSDRAAHIISKGDRRVLSHFAV